MNKILPLLCAALLLTACASTGVIPKGQDTYMLSKQGTVLSSGASVKAALFKEAHAWCTARGLEMIVIDERSEDGIPGGNFANAEITFKAVKRPPNTGPSAEAYDRAALEYDAEGKPDMAKLAREKAAEVRAAAKR
jgi:hypothetical protein